MVLKALADSISTGLHVACAGIIQSFDPDAVTATIQPAVKVPVRQADGSVVSVALPLLVDVPVEFPRGGGVTLTFPIKPGDECVVEFADRCIDYWWQNGGVQEPVDPRQHHLADAFARVGPQSQAKKISGISTSAAQFRSDDGSTYLEIDPTSKKMKIVAPGGLEVITPLADFSEAVTIKGLLSWMGGMVGSIAEGTAAKITGTVEFIGKVFANGKQIDDKHKHGGVQHGSDSTDEVT
ncbi:Gp138 family membrane-puncturing spike protein [Serratia proteamaculans]|uniref:Translation initiation factor IF-2 n=1 Tax=Serratia proteamaculans TaxID=28151 RepID=A0A5Q2VJ28_SERPR|nr:Gp138 family membrane-puncturing spike protein [Serratia proteamaculans]QGH64254.1 translation initiation factor IF-2 [Serratia proteamaculans]